MPDSISKEKGVFGEFEKEKEKKKKWAINFEAFIPNLIPSSPLSYPPELHQLSYVTSEHKLITRKL